MRRFFCAMGVIWLYMILALSALALGACAHKAPQPPAEAPPAVEVLIPVPTPCDNAQIASTALPGASAAIPNDIFDAVKLILGDRAVLKGDNERLKAANTNHCPGIDPAPKAN